MVNLTAQELSRIDPANSATYAANAARYIARIEAADQEIQASFKTLWNRMFIVYHPAFGYFAEEYNLTMVALEEEGKEATAAHLQEMIDLAKEENIKVIFYQEEIDSSQSEAYAEEIGGKTAGLEPLAANYTENLKKMAVVMAEAME